MIKDRREPNQPIVDRRCKHLLPIVGAPIRRRLVRALQSKGFTECVAAIQADDAVTVPSLEELIRLEPLAKIRRRT